MSDTTVAAIRAQRAEVEALLAFKHAEPGEEENLAWWRLQQARVARRAVLSDKDAARLPTLPPPPAHALSWWQGVKQRLGVLKVEQESPPRAIARRLGSARGA
ncbi:hypothetical protein [Roseomonas sp. AR75]|uniref:hypothetical protein n=1 Tax=Roseomonas sp. AR75 TaxID=2562311 RepID=UPI0010BFAC71|nr:hypothetical protein [Roseomonas sp. AR75]